VKLITLSLYNRLEYTKKVLDALSLCHGVKDYVILPVIDRTPRGWDFQQTFVDLLHSYALAGKLNIDNPRLHDNNVGCNSNIFTCLNIGFQVTDFLIHLEDDIVLGEDALKYFEWANTQFKDDKTVFTVDAYNNTQHQTTPDPHMVQRSQSFKPWGWATWKDRWDGIKDKWQHGYGKREDLPNGGGWDVCMKQALRGNRCRIYPTLARCMNIGEVGLHTPSKEWHWNKHTVSYWNRDLFQKQDFTFKEQP
jgi:hypothetical protein